MANRKLLLCLFFVYFAGNFIECKWGGGRSSSRGSSSSGRSWGSSSSHSYKPSSSSSWHSSASKPSWSSSSGTHSYPSSHSGLSGSGSGSHGYPSSSSGLSGSGSSSHGYPSSSSGLSGSGSSNHGYPSSSTGLSGSGSGSHSYPSSSSGTSGINHGYPSSATGLSGSGSRPPSSGTHTYPSSSSGISGSGHSSGTYNPYPTQHGGSWSTSGNYKPSYDTSYHPSQTYHTNTGYVSGSHNYGYGSHKIYSIPPTYYTSPQYVYVNEYRNSGSRYGDILTGLALYDLGRSHSHYHDHHYYNDDYYRRRYQGSSSSGYTPRPEATCSLTIKENGRLEVLKIPCEIVSTFTEDSKKSPSSQNVMNTTVCVTNTTVVNKTLPANEPSKSFTMAPNGTLIPSIGSSNLTTNGSVVATNVTATNATISSNVTMINSTSCTSTVVEKDPLTVKGPPVDPSKMECIVNINTKDAYFTRNVDCQTLLQYSKTPLSKNQGSSIVPSRNKLKSWLSNPPWWLSVFVIG